MGNFVRLCAFLGLVGCSLALVACGDDVGRAPASQTAALGGPGATCGSEAPSCNPGLICVGNVCQACPSGTTGCNNACVDPASFQSDARNCGTCNHQCGILMGDGDICVAGQCVCASGETMCPNWGCTNLGSDSNNCGSCGHVCGSEQTCVNGSCQNTPCAGFKFCDCGLWVAPSATCPARSCDPCQQGFKYCGCNQGCLVDDLTCPSEPNECGNGICHGALRDCGGGIKADPDAACPNGPRVGDGTIESNADSDGDGVAEAFQYTAGASGTISVISLYLDGNNTATNVVVGLYSDDNDNPGTLLAQGTISSVFHFSGWHTASVPTVSVAAGSKYWIAILAPENGGTIQFRDRDDGASTSQTSAESSLTTLPATWTTGTVWSTSSASAYAAH